MTASPSMPGSPCWPLACARCGPLRATPLAYGRIGPNGPRRLQSCQQCVVAYRRCDSLNQPFHRRLRRHLTQTTTQRVHAVDLIRTEQLLLATRAARPNVDRRIDALLREAAVELDLAVARALELLEDHVVHARPRLDDRRRDDRQRSAAGALRDRSRRAKECFRLRHRRRIE